MALMGQFPNFAILFLQIKKIHPAPTDCPCLGVATELKDTLQRMCSTNELFALFDFWTTQRQIKVFQYLKQKDPKLYSDLDANRRSILVRATGIISPLLSQGDSFGLSTCAKTTWCFLTEWQKGKTLEFLIQQGYQPLGC